MANGADIIIRGGSVDIQYDESLYHKEGTLSHKNYDKRITKITVADEIGNILYDSGEDKNGLKGEIRAYCE